MSASRKYGVLTIDAWLACKDQRIRPRSKEAKDSFDGSKPLADSRHEAVAQFLSTPKSERECKSVTALGRHEGVSRKTIYEWMKLPNVAPRVQFSFRNGFSKTVQETAARHPATISLRSKKRSRQARVHEQRFYVARYVRRSPIAQYRFTKITDRKVEF